MKKILVIEDEAIILLGMLNLLERNGFEVIGANNGYQGIQLAIEQVPHLILCNVQMPKRNGYQVFEELYNNPVTGKIPFLFITAQNFQIELLKNPDLEVVNYITKPYEPEELLQIITRMIGS